MNRGTGSIAALATVLASCIRAPAEAPLGSREQEVEPERPWAAGVAPKRQARALELFRQANQVFERSHYQMALSGYEKALTLWNHPAIHYNAAMCLLELNEPWRAYQHIVQALQYGAAPLPSHLYRQGLAYRRLLLDQLARLDIRCDEVDARVSVDGQEILSGPGRTEIITDPGTHQVKVGHAGYFETRTVTLPPGSRVVVRCRDSHPGVP